MDFVPEVPDHLAISTSELSPSMYDAKGSYETGFSRAKGGSLKVPYANEILAAARQTGLDPMLIAEVIRQESGFRHYDSRGNVILGKPTRWGQAIGLMQLIPSTAFTLKVNARDPAQNILGGARYLKQQLAAFGGRLDLALAAYNAGPDNVRNDRVPNIPETTKYVKNILGRYQAAQDIAAMNAQLPPDVWHQEPHRSAKHARNAGNPAALLSSAPIVGGPLGTLASAALGQMPEGPPAPALPRNAGTGNHAGAATGGLAVDMLRGQNHQNAASALSQPMPWLDQSEESSPPPGWTPTPAPERFVKSVLIPAAQRTEERAQREAALHDRELRRKLGKLHFSLDDLQYSINHQLSRVPLRFGKEGQSMDTQAAVRQAEKVFPGRKFRTSTLNPEQQERANELEPGAYWNLPQERIKARRPAGSFHDQWMRTVEQQGITAEDFPTLHAFQKTAANILDPLSALVDLHQPLQDWGEFNTSALKGVGVPDMPARVAGGGAIAFTPLGRALMLGSLAQDLARDPQGTPGKVVGGFTDLFSPNASKESRLNSAMNWAFVAHGLASAKGVTATQMIRRFNEATDAIGVKFPDAMQAAAEELYAAKNSPQAQQALKMLEDAQDHLKGIAPKATAEVPGNHPAQTPASGHVITDPQGFKYHVGTAMAKDIGVKPGLQYKRAGITDTKNAITSEFKDVTAFDPVTSGPLTTWIQDVTGKGEQYAVNGHHRREIAERTGYDKPLETRALKESDGVDMKTARAIGALQNIRDGKGTALDAATALRDLGATREDLQRAGVSLRSSVARNATGLLNLSPEALRYVEEGEIPEGAAAGIGEAQLSPAHQVATIKEAIRVGLETRQQGQLLAESARNQPLVQKPQGESGDLFEIMAPELAIGEGAKISDQVIKRLVAQGRLYKALTRGKAAGETSIDIGAQDSAAAVQEFAQKVLATDPETSRILQEEALGYAKQPTTERLRQATERVAAAAEAAANRRIDALRAGRSDSPAGVSPGVSTGGAGERPQQPRPTGGGEAPSSRLTPEPLTLSHGELPFTKENLATIKRAADKGQHVLTRTMIAHAPDGGIVSVEPGAVGELLPLKGTDPYSKNEMSLYRVQTDRGPVTIGDHTGSEFIDAAAFVKSRPELFPGLNIPNVGKPEIPGNVQIAAPHLAELSRMTGEWAREARGNGHKLSANDVAESLVGDLLNHGRAWGYPVDEPWFLNSAANQLRQTMRQLGEDWKGTILDPASKASQADLTLIKPASDELAEPTRFKSSDEAQKAVDDLEDTIEASGRDPLNAVTLSDDLKTWKASDPHDATAQELARAYNERDRLYKAEDSGALAALKFNPETLKGPLSETQLRELAGRLQRLQYGTNAGRWKANEVADVGLHEALSIAYRDKQIDPRLIDQPEDVLRVPGGKAFVQQVQSFMNDLGLVSKAPADHLIDQPEDLSLESQKVPPKKTAPREEDRFAQPPLGAMGDKHGQYNFMEPPTPETSPVAEIRAAHEPPEGTREATPSGEMRSPRTGLTPKQEKYLSERLKAEAENLPMRGPEPPRTAGRVPTTQSAMEMGRASVTVDVPGDGSFTVHSREQANALHHAVTGEPLPGMAAPRIRSNVELTDYSAAATREADRAMHLYGDARTALEKIKEQWNARRSSVGRDGAPIPVHPDERLLYKATYDELRKRVDTPPPPSAAEVKAAATGRRQARTQGSGAPKPRLVYRSFDGDLGPNTKPNAEARFGPARYFSDSKEYADNWGASVEDGRGYKHPETESIDISGLKIANLDNAPTPLIRAFAEATGQTEAAVRYSLGNRSLEDLARRDLPAKGSLFPGRRIGEIAQKAGYDGIEYRGEDGIREFAIFDKPAASGKQPWEMTPREYKKWREKNGGNDPGQVNEPMRDEYSDGTKRSNYRFGDEPFRGAKFDKDKTDAPAWARPPFKPVDPRVLRAKLPEGGSWLVVHQAGASVRELILNGWRPLTRIRPLMEFADGPQYASREALWVAPDQRYSKADVQRLGVRPSEEASALYNEWAQHPERFVRDRNGNPNFETWQRSGETKPPEPYKYPVPEKGGAADLTQGQAEEGPGHISESRRDYDPEHRRIVEQAIREGKPVPQHVLDHYPDLGPIEAHSGFDPRQAIDQALNRGRSGQKLYATVGDRIRNFFIENMSTLGRFAPDAKTAAARLATSTAEARTITRVATRAVNSAAKDSTAYPRLRTLLVASRLRGIRDRWGDMADFVRTLDDSAFQKEFNDLHDTLASTLGVDKQISAEIASGDIAAARNGLADAYDSAAQRVNATAQRLLSDADFAAEAKDPTIRRALAAYKQHVEKPFADSHASNDGIFSTALGPMQTYFPLSPIDAQGNLLHRVANLTKSQPFTPRANTRNAFATGLAPDYDLSMEAFGNAVAQAVKANNQAHLIDLLEANGLIRKVTIDQRAATPTPTIDINGTTLEARYIETKPPTSIFNNGQRVVVPGKYAVVPEFLYSEVHHVLKGNDRAVPALLNKANAYGMAGPLDMVYHTTNVLGTLVANTPFIGQSVLSKTIGNTPVTKLLNSIYQTVRTATADETALVDLQDMAKAGALTEKYGTVTLSKRLSEETGTPQNRLAVGRAFLYGPNGLDIRARLVMWRVAKQIMPNASPLEKARFVNQLGLYNRALESQIGMIVKSAGWSPFYTAGKTMYLNGLRAWLGGGMPMPSNAGILTKLKYRAAQQVSGGAIGYVATWAVLHHAITGAWPWDDKKYAKFGQLPVVGPLKPVRDSWVGQKLWGPSRGKDGGERTGYINLAFSNPITHRGSQALGVRGAFNIRALGGNPGQVQDAALVDAANAAMHPFTSGPGFQGLFIAATGHEPALAGTRDLQGRMALRLFQVSPDRGGGFKQVAENIKQGALRTNSVVGNIGESLGFIDKPYWAQKDEEPGAEAMQSVFNIALPRLISKPEDRARRAKFMQKQGKAIENEVKKQEGTYKPTSRKKRYSG